MLVHQVAGVPATCIKGFAACDAVVSWVLGMSLICSSTAHLGNPYFLLHSVYSYRLVGPGIGQIVATILPFLEVTVAVCLVANFLRAGAYALILAMLVAFATVQTAAWMRGLDIACGCFGPRHATRIGGFTLSIVYGLLFLSLTRVVGCWWAARTVGARLGFDRRQ